VYAAHGSLCSILVPVILSHPLPPRPSPPQSQAPPSPPSLVTQEPSRARSRETLLAESKELMKKLEGAKTLEEKKSLMGLLKETNKFVIQILLQYFILVLRAFFIFEYSLVRDADLPHFPFSTTFRATYSTLTQGTIHRFANHNSVW